MTLRQILLIAEREFREYARQRSFRNGTLVSMAMIVAAVAAYSIFPALFGGPDDLRVGVLAEGRPVAEVLPLLVDPDAVEVEVVDLHDRTTAERHLHDGDLDVVVTGPTSVTVLEDLDGATAELLTNAMTAASLAAELDATPAEALSAAAVELSVDVLDPADPIVVARRVLTLIAVFMVLGQVMTGAYMVASGMVEEKASRVVEVIVAKAHPRLLLTGKLIGLGGVLFAQLVVLVITGLVAVAVSPDLSIPDGIIAVSGSVLLWYLVAFAIYGALFSVAGALSSRQEDMAQKMAPMMYVLMATFAAAFYAFLNPDTVLTAIVTYIPFTAPAVLPARQASGSLGLVEGSVAVLVALVGAALAVRFAGWVYTAGALRTRGSSTIRRTLRADAAS